MPTVSEATVIDTIAQHERAITGVKNSYGWDENPGALSNAQLPAVVHFQPTFSTDLFAHHNIHRNEFTIQSILLVKPREAKGAKIKLFRERSNTVFEEMACKISELHCHSVPAKLRLAQSLYANWTVWGWRYPFNMEWGRIHRCHFYIHICGNQLNKMRES